MSPVLAFGEFSRMALKPTKTFEEFIESAEDLPDPDEFPWVYGKDGNPYQLLSKDMGGLTLTAQWVRTDALTTNKFDPVDYFKKILDIRSKILN